VTTTRVVAGPGRPGRTEQLGCLSLVAFMASMAAVLGLGPVLAGHVAYVVTGRPWPHTSGLPWATWHLWAHPGNPLRDWPSEGGRPGAWVVWAVSLLLIVAVFAVVIAAAIGVRAVRRPHRPSVEGMASAQQEHRGALTSAALREAAPSLRPTLTQSVKARDIRPEQLGSYLGISQGTGQKLYQKAETSAIVCGLTGSGKTTTTIIPSVLDWDGPQLISTTKVDIARATWHKAADTGGAVMFDLMNLTGGVFPALKWTPLEGCQDPDLADGRSRVLTDRGQSAGHDPNAEFRAEGRRVVRGLLHAAGLADATMSEALGWVFNPMDQTPETIIRGAGYRGYQLYADNLAAARRSPEKQREGAYMTVRGAFDEMAAPKVLRGIDHRPSQSFSIGNWLRQGQGTVYLLSHKVDMAGAEKVVSIMVADILREAREQAVASAGGRLDPLLNFWADEALNACQLSCWDSVLADSRGWGISAKMAIQSRALLRGRYGRESGDAIWSASGVRMMIGGGEGGTDTKELAEAFGDHEVSIHSVNTGGGSTIGSRREAVRTASTVRNLEPGKAIMLASQTPPIELALRPWWERDDAPQITTATKAYDQARLERRQLLPPTTLGARR